MCPILSYQNIATLTPVCFTLTSALEFCKEGHQSRDTKIEISAGFVPSHKKP